MKRKYTKLGLKLKYKDKHDLDKYLFHLHLI